VLEQTKTLSRCHHPGYRNAPHERLGALTRIMAESPRPVIMLSSLTRQARNPPLTRLERGALISFPSRALTAANGIFEIRDDWWPRSRPRPMPPGLRPDHPPARASARAVPNLSAQVQAAPAIVAWPLHRRPEGSARGAFTIAGSTWPTGILIVQHMPVDSPHQFADRLNHLCRLAVREAKGEETIDPGTVYIAPAGIT